jgi:hypothetical protein
MPVSHSPASACLVADKNYLHVLGLSNNVMGMRLAVFFVFLSLCFALFSCSHNPYQDFEKIHVGEDKEQLLEKVGSPLRSSYTDGKDLWTYRFYVNDQMIYKDVTLENGKIVGIQNSKEIDYKSIEEKEKKIEEELKKTPEAPYLEKRFPAKKKLDDSELNEKKSQPDDFKEVEPAE